MTRKQKKAIGKCNKPNDLPCLLGIFLLLRLALLDRLAGVELRLSFDFLVPFTLLEEDRLRDELLLSLREEETAERGLALSCK